MRLIYISPVPWNSFAQRPHHFVNWFQNRYKAQVLWIDPYPSRLPKMSDWRKLMPRKAADSAANKPQWLSLIRPKALPVEPIPLISRLNELLWKPLAQDVAAFADEEPCAIVIGKPSALAVKLLRCRPWPISLYDAMDDFPAFYYGRSQATIHRHEQQIAQLVTYISASSSALKTKFQQLERPVSLILNGCLTSVLCSPERPGPTDTTKPVLGYIGTIAYWFDWRLIIQLAKALPSARIQLVGPVHQQPPDPLPDNITVSGPCSHHAAMELAQQFDIGLIPFINNELTAAVDPVKFYEYRALGLPVISTRFGEMTGREGDPGVFLIDKEKPLDAVQSALSYRPAPKEIETFRSENDWQHRFVPLGELFDSALFPHPTDKPLKPPYDRNKG